MPSALTSEKLCQWEEHSSSNINTPRAHMRK